MNKNERILIAWQLGTGLGHISNLVTIAKGLKDSGYDLFFAVSNVSNAHSWLCEFGQILQAPNETTPLGFQPATFTEILLSAGFMSPHVLHAQTSAWNAMFDLIKPKLLIADHAPVAMLAAKLANIAYANLGTGFFMPSAAEMNRSFRTWEKPTPDRHTQMHELAIKNINQVAEIQGRKGLQRKRGQF